MQDTFNAYREWLGIPDGRQPGNHYELLGLPLCEGSAEAIAREADALVARIRRIRPGPHLAQWQQMLDAVGQAKACLLDPAAKAAYDAALRGQTAAPEALPGVAPLLLRMACVMAATAMLVAGLLLYQHYRQPPETARNDAAAESRPAPRLGPTAPPKPTGQDEPGSSIPPGAQPLGGRIEAASPQPKPTGSESQAPAPGDSAVPPQEKPAGEEPGPEGARPPAGEPGPRPAVDPKKQETFRKAVATARFALTKRDFAAAKRQLEAARATAQAPPEEAEVVRLEALTGNLEEFWKGMRRVLAGLTPAQELTIGNTPIIVVAADATQLTFRSEGKNQTCRLQELPRPVIEALVESGFAKHPSSKILLGTYMAMDPNGDRRRARSLWEEAAEQGEDVTNLLAELDAAARPGVRGSRTLPALDPAKLQEAEQAVKARFQAEYRKATSPGGKSALAQKLLEAGAAIQGEPEAQFVMFREARDLAAAAGKPALACDAVEKIAEVHAVDPLSLKVELLEECAGSARIYQVYREIAEQGLLVLEEAVKAGRGEEAKRIGEVAVSAAQKSRSATLLKSARDAVQGLQSSAPETPPLEPKAP